MSRERTRSPSRHQPVPRFRPRASSVGGLVASKDGTAPASAPTLAGPPTALAITPQCMAQFTSLSDTLQEAALALRRLVPMQAGSAGVTQQQTKPTDAANHSSLVMEEQRGSDILRMQKSGFTPVQAACKVVRSESNPSPSINADPSVAAIAVAAMTAEKLLVPTIQRLVVENASLREAFNHANQRLMQLQEEKQRFLDEGIYDLVNSVCGQTGKCGPRKNGAQLQPRIADGLSIPLSPCARAPESVLSAQLRLSEEKKRSEEFTGENEELRRELARSSEEGEVLEQEQRAAEDRMHQLEQQQVWLADWFEGLSPRGSGLRPGVSASPEVEVPVPIADTAVPVSLSSAPGNTSCAEEGMALDASGQVAQLDLRLTPHSTSTSRTVCRELEAVGRQLEVVALDEHLASSVQQRGEQIAHVEDRLQALSAPNMFSEALEERLCGAEAQIGDGGAAASCCLTPQAGLRQPPEARRPPVLDLEEAW